ncbi:MAG: penicillin acylase family protein [Desulfobacterales bacterium]
MKWIKRILGLVLILLIGIITTIIVIINPFGASPLNNYTKEGNLSLPGLKAPVTVHRDEKGMAYIYARNLEDLYVAQGFVTAQDRLFQMELTRLFASGRISELAGEKGRQLDLRMRTLGFRRHAKKHAALLNEKTRKFLQKYVDGVNAFIETRPENIHLEFKLAGLKPSLWEIADSLTILYYMGWGSAANVNSEIIAQMLIEKIGPVKAAEIFPLNINPDDETGTGARITKPSFENARLNLKFDPNLLANLNDGPLKIGSNNWSAAPDLSPGGKPIVANDPHLEANILPGPWYPCGLITPDLRAIGVTIPGIGGMVIGRTNHIAAGVTNAYGDTQDLYVEMLDPENPDNYLEGNVSIPFEVIEETWRFKDKTAEGGFKKEKLKIRLTRRGPVISGVMPGLKTDRVITVRYSSFEAMAPSIGLERFLECRTVDELRRALKDVNQISLNIVFADSRGDIGWQVTGKLPIRARGEGLIPYVVRDSRDNWTGWIPWDDMPHTFNPARGWVGTCNHLTVRRDYPYHYTTHASPSQRYRRLMELMDAPGQKSVDDHWEFQRDATNLMAKKIAPVMSRALLDHADTRKMGQLLADWDFVDSANNAAPTVCQATYREFALLVYADELGDDLARAMLNNWNFWQERLQKMVLENKSVWFDNIHTTDKKETRDDLFHQAALKAATDLESVMGADPAKWMWGNVHRHEFVSPLRLSGPGSEWLGGGSHPAAGSGETLYRGIYDFNQPYKITVSASLRMVADLGDPDKILAVLPGGVAGRQFDPHTTDQVKSFMDGTKVYWWFSDKAIREHTKHTLTLSPN